MHARESTERKTAASHPRLVVLCEIPGHWSIRMEEGKVSWQSKVFSSQNKTFKQMAKSFSRKSSQFSSVGDHG